MAIVAAYPDSTKVSLEQRLQARDRRNARAQPKTNFAPNSVIRTWTGYQTNVA